MPLALFQTELTERQRKHLGRVQKLDVTVYNHFQSVFQKAVEEFGEERMNKSVAELRKITKQAGACSCSHAML